MNYLLDTDEVVNYFRARRPDDTRAGSLIETDERLFISLITYYEVYDGIYRGRNPAKAEAGFLKLLERVYVLSMDKELMRLAARIRGQLEAGGRRIGDPDVIVGATSVYYDLLLVTGNMRHFERIAGLRLFSGHVQT